MSFAIGGMLKIIGELVFLAAEVRACESVFSSASREFSCTGR